MELGKYFSVCFGREFVLAALIVAVVMGCIGIFLGFLGGVPQVQSFVLQDKAKLWILNITSKHQSFGRLDHCYLLQGLLMFPLKPVTLSWTVLDCWG